MRVILFSAVLFLFSISVHALTIQDETTSYESFSNENVILKGKVRLTLSGSGQVLNNSTIDIEGDDGWIFFSHHKPSEVHDNWLQFITVDGNAAVHDTTVRIVPYVNGAVVLPHSPDFQPLTVYKNNDLGGERMKAHFYTYYTKDTLAALGFDDAIQSFVLKRGYMATFAQNDEGQGYSRVWIADEDDVVVNALPEMLNQKVSHFRVIPWRWTAKKGWAGGYNDANLIDAKWRYGWNAGGSSTLDMEYIPMRHNGNWDAYSKINSKLNTTHVLGFNEPERHDQGNISVEKALAQWPKLLKSGLRIGSPVPADNGREWLYKFMDKAEKMNLRVDFIALHWYKGNQTPDQLYNYCKTVWNKYKRPIWVTEWNNGANWTDNLEKVTQDKQAKELPGFLNKLENSGIIERYAIYNWVGDGRKMVNGGSVTKSGELYRDKVSKIAFKSSNVFTPIYTEFPNITEPDISHNGDNLILSWYDNYETETGFEIQRIMNYGEWENLSTTSPDVSSYADTGTMGNTVGYRVRALGTDQNSSWASSSFTTLIHSDHKVGMGNITIETTGKDDFLSVRRQVKAEDNPIITLGSVSNNGSDQVTLRGRSVGKVQFQVQLDEWDYKDGAHNTAEQFSYLSLPPGNQDYDDLKVIAGKVDSVKVTWQSVEFDPGFTRVPKVFANVFSVKGGAAVSVAVRNVSADGFELRLKEEENQDNSHSPEVVHYLAVDGDEGLIHGHRVVLGSAEVSSNETRIDFGNKVTNAGVFAFAQTFNEADPFFIRHTEIDENGFSIYLQEEQSNDDETNHVSETVAWMAIEEINTPTDCNGDLGGSAFIDECDECVGGNTGLEACIPGQSSSFKMSSSSDEFSSSVDINFSSKTQLSSSSDSTLSSSDEPISSSESDLSSSSTDEITPVEYNRLTDDICRKSKCVVEIYTVNGAHVETYTFYLGMTMYIPMVNFENVRLKR